MVKKAKKEIAVITDRAQALTTVIESIQKKYGQGALKLLEDVPEIVKQATNLDELDDLLLGGVPVGRLIVVQGKEASGKTAIACQLLSGCDRILYIDSERKMTPDMAALMHLSGSTVIATPKSLEEALDLCRISIQAGAVDGIVIDTLPGLPVLKEVLETDMTKVTGMSQTAGILSRKLPVFLPLLQENNVTLIIVNQLRDNINVASPWAEKYHAFGGHALKHYASLVLATARMSWLKHPKLLTYGAELAVQIEKVSGMAVPRSATNLALVYGYGLLPYKMVPDARKELLDSGYTGTPIQPDSNISIEEELQGGER